MLVKEIMSKDVIYLSPEDNVSELISLIEKRRIIFWLGNIKFLK